MNVIFLFKLEILLEEELVLIIIVFLVFNVVFSI